MNDENSGRYVSVKSVDMFGRTVTATDIQMDVSSHVETVALLSRKSATKTFIPETISPKDMGLTEEKAQPTYEDIKQ